MARARLDIGPRAERAAMLVVLGWALLTRLVGCASAQQPRVFFAQAGVVYTADALQAHDLGQRWLGQFRNLQAGMEHESPIEAPVSAAIQRIVGPSPLELPVIVGAFWGVLAVLLAWRLGRAVETPAFGVLFAAFMAVSPLQLTWARLGGIYIGSPAAVLLVLWTGWLVGTRGGIAAAVLFGIVAWPSS